MRTSGLLLAAGAGRRMGQPKALKVDDGVPWALSACQVLLDGGCNDVFVVIGAGAKDVRALFVKSECTLVQVPGVSVGLSASLRAGLKAASKTSSDICLIHLVDLPDVTAEVVQRVRRAASGTSLVRASYAGKPGHPVAIARSHWAAVANAISGDTGANDYLKRNNALLIECGDLATGEDVDEPGSRLAPEI